MTHNYLSLLLFHPTLKNSTFHDSLLLMMSALGQVMQCHITLSWQPLCVVLKVTNHARSAMLHFYSPNISFTPVSHALKSFFVSCTLYTLHCHL